MVDHPLIEDLNHILQHTEGLWKEIYGQKLFITGGTGFFGCWLLESFVWANDNLGLNSSIVVLTRNFHKFKLKAPHLAVHPSISFHIGDVRDFDFPKSRFSHIIYASNEALEFINKKDYIKVIDAMIQSAKHILEFAKECDAKILFTSSGTVYGPQPPEITYISENYKGHRDNNDFRSSHGEGKYAAECLYEDYAKRYGLETKIARCFTFLGPYLPIDSNYAVGNFIRDGLLGIPIHVNGDGTPYRSYLYAADLAIWLWTILFKGKSCYPYNVGSMESITIKELAELISIAFPKNLGIKVEKLTLSGHINERYVPDTNRAKTELNLCQWISLIEGIRRTINWHLITKRR